MSTYQAEIAEDMLDIGITAVSSNIEFAFLGNLIEGIKQVHGWWKCNIKLSEAAVDFSANIAVGGAMGKLGWAAGQGIGLLFFGRATSPSGHHNQLGFRIFLLFVLKSFSIQREKDCILQTIRRNLTKKRTLLLIFYL